MDFGCLMLTLAFSVTPGTDVTSHKNPDAMSVHRGSQSAGIGECRPMGLEALDEQRGATQHDGFFCVAWGAYGLVG
jgi:hypothetical protein